MIAWVKMRLVLCVLMLVVARAAATLVCPTRASAVSLVASALARAPVPRFYVGRLAPAALTDLAALDTFLTRDLHLLVPAPYADSVSVSSSEDDVRQLYLPPEWMPSALLAYTEDSGSDTACGSATASVAAGGSGPPSELSEVLAVIITYATTIAPVTCESNEVVVHNGDATACGCPPGRDCVATTSVDTSLEIATNVCMLVVLVFLLFGGLIPVVVALRRLSTLMKRVGGGTGGKKGQEMSLLIKS